MELIRRVAPYDASAALKLLEDTFGYEEVIVEAPQLMGAEAAVNTDIVWEAWKNNLLVGTIHATIPKACPSICGLSAMVTHPCVRGKGLGRILFAKIIMKSCCKMAVTFMRQWMKTALSALSSARFPLSRVSAVIFTAVTVLLDCFLN